VNTGGAHGSLNITFLNFNPENGNLLSLRDIINDLETFKNLAKIILKKPLVLMKKVLLKITFLVIHFSFLELLGLMIKVLFYHIMFMKLQLMIRD